MLVAVLFDISDELRFFKPFNMPEPTLLTANAAAVAACVILYQIKKRDLVFSLAHTHVSREKAQAVSTC